ncbi:head GIN domain-containing protein [Frigoriglobus tundricola]|nr:head GIN domain-containing protein [Frigoriglobus tundricola]
MIRFGFLSSALIGGGLLALATTARDPVDGSGVPATEERFVGDVTEVTFSGIGEMTIVQGVVPSLSVTADDNVLPALETKVNGRKLTVQTRSRSTISPKTKITYTLTTPRLESVTVSGAGNVRTEKFIGDALTVKLSGAGNARLRDANFKSLNVNVSGAGTASASGSAEKLTLRISGAGDVEAAALKTGTSDVQISGAGNATVWATEALKARVSGAGGIKYKGAPQVEQKVSGAGSVRALNG